LHLVGGTVRNTLEALSDNPHEHLFAQIKSTRTERTYVEVDSIFKSLTAETQTHSSVTESNVVKVRQDYAKFK